MPRTIRSILSDKKARESNPFFADFSAALARIAEYERQAHALLESIREGSIVEDIEAIREIATRAAKNESSEWRASLESRLENIVSTVEDARAEIRKEFKKRVDDEYARFCDMCDERINAIKEENRKDRDEVRNSLVSDVAGTVRSMKNVVDEAIINAEKRFRDMERSIAEKYGPQGDPGAPGKDGSPDTPEQVVEKVNKKGGVDMKSVEGLMRTLEAIRSEIRVSRRADAGAGAGGGGMGNTVHENFPVTSATTSVTLRSKVAANGFAASVYYNGQQMTRGTHWTVSGKIVTLLFTPDDTTPASYIDVVYVRT